MLGVHAMVSALLKAFYYTNVLYDNLMYKNKLCKCFPPLIYPITLSSAIFKVFPYITFCILTIKICAKSNI